MNIHIRTIDRGGDLHDLVLEREGAPDAYTVLAEGITPEQAQQLIYDALTAPLADAEKLATVDELSSVIQSINDAVIDLQNQVEQLRGQVAGIDVLTELGRLAGALAAGALVSGPTSTVTAGPRAPQTPLQTTTTSLRRPVAPGAPVRPRPSQPSGPDRGLARTEDVPHQPRGGAVSRGQAVTEHGEG